MTRLLKAGFLLIQFFSHSRAVFCRAARLRRKRGIQNAKFKIQN
jgi:hypothetical protein